MSKPRWLRAAFVGCGIAGGMTLAACGHDSSGPNPSQPLVGGLHAAGNTTCASIEDEGTAFCWGANEFGQVGDGTTTDRLRPTPVPGAPLFSAPFPGDHTCALDPAGLYCWGRNVTGEVGVGTTSPVTAPALVTGGLVFYEIVMGDDFSCGTTISGVYCWGANDVGQLGTGKPGGSSVPVPVAGNAAVGSLAAGGRTVCGLTGSGGILCWGNGADGELGNGQFGVSATTPTPVSGNLQFLEVAIGANAAGQATVCAETPTGPYCWGKNSDGEIGDGTTERRSVPTAVVGLGAAQIAPGGSHTCARASEVDVYCWGKGGRLGTGTNQGSLTPVKVAGGHLFAALWSGRDHTCGRSDDEPSRAFCWGDNARGQLGDGTRTARLLPTLVTF